MLILIFKSLFFFILIVLLGYIIVRAEWKLKYLVPLCFFGVFSLFFSVFWLFARDGRYIELFVNGKFSPNEYTISALQASASLGGSMAFLLIAIVIAARYQIW